MLASLLGARSRGKERGAFSCSFPKDMCKQRVRMRIQHQWNNIGRVGRIVECSDGPLQVRLNLMAERVGLIVGHTWEVAYRLWSGGSVRCQQFFHKDLVGASRPDERQGIAQLSICLPWHNSL